MSIEFKIDVKPTSEQFIDLLERSGLAARRPVDDRQCIAGMLDNANLMITAWHGQNLVGIARSVTDFHYACYLSDLAVDMRYQGQGIGKQLQSLTQQQLGPQCKLILIAAPDANAYYQHIGYSPNPRCWVLDRDVTIV